MFEVGQLVECVNTRYRQFLTLGKVYEVLVAKYQTVIVTSDRGLRDEYMNEAFKPFTPRVAVSVEVLYAD